jgi:hypothetical protein
MDEYYYSTAASYCSCLYKYFESTKVLDDTDNQLKRDCFEPSIQASNSFRDLVNDHMFVKTTAADSYCSSS